MNKTVWIIDPYTDLPTRGNRFGRYHLIAENLASFNLDVKVFISNFSHQTKSKQIINQEESVDYSFTYCVVESVRYDNHISLNRIKYERIFIENMLIEARKLNKPDIIIIRDPALFISKKLLKYIRTHNINYIVDIIDLWPEIFEIVLPRMLKNLSKYIFSYFYNARKNLISGSVGYTAVAPDYLAAIKGLTSTIPSEVIYWGCDYKRINYIVNNTEKSFLSSMDLHKENDDFWIIYSGTLGNNYDIKSILLAAEKLKSYCKIKFILAGSGPLSSFVEETLLSSDLQNVIYLGQVRSDDLFSLFKFCNIGLCTYVQKSTVSMPIKCYDYWAAGLPIINSLKRNLGKLIKEFDIGYNYIPENPYSLVETILMAYNNQKDYLCKKNNVIKFAISLDQDLQYTKFSKFVLNLL
jgi:glycosyltransferase involved in cell wall biosynthesis